MIQYFFFKSIYFELQKSRNPCNTTILSIQLHTKTSFSYNVLNLIGFGIPGVQKPEAHVNKEDCLQIV